MSYVKIHRNVFQPIEDMIKTGLYKNEQEAISALVHDQARLKVEHYTRKIKEMEEKYNMVFPEFEARIKELPIKRFLRNGTIIFSGKVMLKRLIER